MMFFSLRLLKCVLVVVAVLLVQSVSWADIRVIVEYDGTEHRLLRVVDLPLARSAPISDHLQGKSNDTRASSAALSSAAAMSKVKLVWFNADGATISSELIDDPRLTHAPLTSDQSPTVVSLKAGAFVVSGPSESTVLEIHLPANVPLGL